MSDPTLSLDELRDLAPGFVMGTLTADERATFERAMRDPALAAELEPELAVHRAAVDHLATLHPVTPPPALRDRLVARIAEEAAARRAASPDSSAAENSASSPEASPRAPSVEGIIPIPLRARPSRASWWIPAALGAALAATLVLAVALRRERDSLRTELAARAEQLDRTRAELASADSVVRAITEGGNDLRLVRLAPSQPAGPALQVFWNVRQGSAVVHASGLRPVAPDRAYCLWMIRDGKPVAVALFKPEPDGATIVRGIEVPTSTQGIAAFAVTEEPAQGSPQPTMTPFLVGAVGTE